MKKIIFFAALSSFALFTLSSHAGEAKEVLKSGDWSVFSSADTIQGKTACSAIYKNNWTIQASLNAIRIGTRSGIKSYTVRVDEKPAQQTHIDQNAATPLKSISLNIKDLGLLSARHLQVQISNDLGGSVLENIDLDGLGAAVNFMGTQAC